MWHGILVDLLVDSTVALPVCVITNLSPCPSSCHAFAVCDAFRYFWNCMGEKRKCKPNKNDTKREFRWHACMQIYLKKVQQSFLKTQIIVTSKLDPVLLTICN